MKYIAVFAIVMLAPFGPNFLSSAALAAEGYEQLRVARPAITLDMSESLLPAENNREPIADAPTDPGIYRSFLVWRQKYAHLAICNTYLCHGSCVEYGDGCLVSGQSSVLAPLLASAQSAGCARQNKTGEGAAAGRAHCH